MKFNIIALLVSLLSISQAFDIPEDAPDGVFFVGIDANGTALSKPTRISKFEHKKPPARKGRLDTRLTFPDPHTGCDGYAMNANDLAIARTFQWAQCQDNWLPPNWAYYVKWGSAVVYMCNYGGWNPCVGNELLLALSMVDGRCGGSQAGWVLINVWAKGYGRSNTGVGICSWGQQP